MSRGLDEWQTPIKLIMINYLADGNDGDDKDEEDYNDDVKQRRWCDAAMSFFNRWKRTLKLS